MTPPWLNRFPIEAQIPDRALFNGFSSHSMPVHLPLQDTAHAMASRLFGLREFAVISVSALLIGRFDDQNRLSLVVV
jgi:hypothetical protein